MAFGSPISNGTLEVSTAQGYVYGYDLSAQFIRKATRIGVLKTTVNPNVLSSLVQASANRDALWSNLVSASADIAFFQEGTSIFVFYKAATYPFADVNANRIVFWYTRFPILVVQDADKLDINPSARELFKMLVLETMKVDLENRIPFDVAQQIIREKKKLGFS